MNVLIIGGVAAGTKAAAKIKRLLPDAQVTILTKGRDISYAGCGLPYYVGGLIEQKEELIVNTPAKFTALTGANVLVEREVTALLPQSREARNRRESRAIHAKLPSLRSRLSSFRRSIL